MPVQHFAHLVLRKTLIKAALTSRNELYVIILRSFSATADVESIWTTEDPHPSPPLLLFF